MYLLQPLIQLPLAGWD